MTKTTKGVVTILHLMKNDTIIKTFSRNDLSNSNTLRHSVYTEAKAKETSLVCDCAGESDFIPMHMARTKDTVYPRSNGGYGRKHALHCWFHSDHEGDGEHEKGWKETYENNGPSYTITPITKYFVPAKAREKKADIIETTPYSETQRSPKREKGKTKVTLMGMTSKLNGLASLDSYNKGIAPKSIREHIRQAFGTSLKINMGRTGNLQELWYSKYTFHALTGKEAQYVYMPLLKITRAVYPKSGDVIPGLFELVVDRNSFDEKKADELRIKCPETLLEAAIKQHRGDLRGFAVIASGFVKRNKYKQPEFISLALLPVSKNGVWSESSYEKKVFDQLADASLHFYKPVATMDEYGGMMPDFILQNPIDTDKVVIGEVFGIEGVEAYTRQKEKKVECMKAFPPNKNGWYWDVSATKLAIPPIQSGSFEFTFTDY